MSLVFLLHALTPLAFLAVPHPVGTRVRAGTFHRPAAPRDALRPSLAADAVKIALLPPLANFVTDATGAASTPLSAVTRDGFRTGKRSSMLHEHLAALTFATELSPPPTSAHSTLTAQQATVASNSGYSVSHWHGRRPAARPYV